MDRDRNNYPEAQRAAPAGIGARPNEMVTPQPQLIEFADRIMYLIAQAAAATQEAHTAIDRIVGPAPQSTGETNSVRPSDCPTVINRLCLLEVHALELRESCERVLNRLNSLA